MKNIQIIRNKEQKNSNSNPIPALVSIHTENMLGDCPWGKNKKGRFRPEEILPEGDYIVFFILLDYLSYVVSLHTSCAGTISNVGYTDILQLCVKLFGCISFCNFLTTIIW